jgi:hypothetical protein
MSILKDDKGNNSSMRLMLLMFMFAIIIFLAVWMGVFLKESYKDVANYDGLSNILWGGATSGTLALFAKAAQKYFEK